MRQPAATIDTRAAARARERQSQLTKPGGSLARLEDLAIVLAGMQGTERPRADKVRVAVYAADHGVAAERVSAFPQSVTQQMVKNIAGGGAAVSVLAAETGATLEIIDVGTLQEGAVPAGVIDERAGRGTANLAATAAMTRVQLAAALDAGRAAVGRATTAGTQLFIGGDLGIGNTTAAAALACGLLAAPVEALVGPGTGLDQAAIARKAGVISRALQLHGKYLDDPLEALRRLGGFEIAALAGACTTCAQNGVPTLIDGFIASVAALVSARTCPGAGEWFLYAHRSAEPGHAKVLEALRAKPLLDLGMRLGEGTGALAALPLIRLACALHASMATFDEAGVSTADG